MLRFRLTDPADYSEEDRIQLTFQMIQTNKYERSNGNVYIPTYLTCSNLPNNHFYIHSHFAQDGHAQSTLGTMHMQSSAPSFPQ